jgi:tryptophanyl-tRNA synthetase
MRPTGRLHIGHYFGALQNWVQLQNALNQETVMPVPEYECFYFIADWHALTSDYADTSGVAENTLQIMIDYLAAGLDPVGHENCVIFQQSVIPEHAELHLLLSMVTPLGWLERVPTYKEALENVSNRDLHMYGFLGYPVLQTADIAIYSNPGAPLVVPVGEDQVSHVEISREIVRRFNSYNGFRIDPTLFEPAHAQDLKAVLTNPVIEWAPDQDARKATIEWFTQCGVYGPVVHAPTVFDVTVRAQIEAWTRHRAQEVGFDNLLDGVRELRQFFHLVEQLREPEVMLTKTPRIPGLDGRKMSKSYGNAITLSETDEEIRKKTKVMVTDPARKRRTDPGNPDVCPVYDWHKLFSAEEPGRLEWVRQGCTTAGIGCIECKAAMAENLIKWIAPVRERRVKWENDPKGVLEILDEGSKKARVVAQGTMERVREAVFGWKKKRELASGV